MLQIEGVSGVRHRQLGHIQLFYFSNYYWCRVRHLCLNIAYMQLFLQFQRVIHKSNGYLSDIMMILKYLIFKFQRKKVPKTCYYFNLCVR
jgi:hypothetical protein